MKTGPITPRLNFQALSARVLVDDKTGDRTGWTPIEHVRPAFSTPRLTDSADRRTRRRAAKSTVKAAGFIDSGILVPGIYKKGVHEPWMRILTYSRMSGKAQRLDRQLATQFLPLIKDVTTREICAQHSAGRFSEIVHVLIGCVGLRRTRTKPELSDGHANASSTDQELEVDDDGGMHFRTAKGGKMEFVHHATGKVLATVSIATEGRSEVQVTLPEEIEGDEHAAITSAAEGMEQERIDASAKRLPAIRGAHQNRHGRRGVVSH